MALRPQTNSLVAPLLALGVVRVGTDNELYSPDGTVLGYALQRDGSGGVPFVPMLEPEADLADVIEKVNRILEVLDEAGILMRFD